MIQRSQTLFLLGAFILAVLMLTGPLATLTGLDVPLELKHSGLFSETGEKQDLATWPLTALFAAVSLLSFLNVFSYRNRSRQMRLCVFLMLVSAGSMGMIFYYIWIAGQRFSSGDILYNWRIVIPLIIIVLIYLAFRGIRRDEATIKAFDRIR